MNFFFIVFGFIIVIILLIGAVFVFNLKTVSIEYLKTKGRVSEIIDIFSNEKTEIARRKEALAALVELATPEAVKALLNGLSSRNIAIIYQLTIELPKLGPQIYPNLLKAYTKIYTRPGATRVLAAMGQDAGLVLAPLLKDPNPVLKNACIQTLDQLKWKPGQDLIGANYWIAKRHPEKCAEIGSVAVPELLAVLKDPGLCRGAIEALGEIGDVSAGWPLLNIAKNPQQRLRVIKAIAKWRDNAIPLLSEALFNNDPKIQETALYILDLMVWRATPDEMGARYWALKHNWNKLIELGDLAVTPLLELANEKNPDIRKNAIRSLGLIGDESALEKLLTEINDPDIEISRAVVEALSRYKHPQAINALITKLNEDNLVSDLSNALIKIGKPAINALIQALSFQDLKIRGRVADILEKMTWTPESDFEKTVFWIARQEWNKCVLIGSPAVEMLVKELNNEQNCVNVAQAIAKIGDVGAISAIVEAFAGKPISVQKELAKVLGSMGPAVVEPLLIELEHGQIELVPVIYALGETADIRCAKPLTELLKESYPVSVREAAAAALGKIGLPAVDSIFDILRGEGVNPKAAGIALGEAAKTTPDRLIKALKTKEFDAQVLVYALGKIPEESAAKAILHALQNVQYGQEIRTTAQEALFEIGTPSINPIIDCFIHSPEDHSLYSSMLVRFGSVAVENLIWSMENSFNPLQCEAIINVLGDIGDVRAVNPLVDILKRHNINGKLVNGALDKIWKKQRWEKERAKGAANQV